MKTLNLKAITIDAGTQTRARTNEAKVFEYAEAMEEGAAFPPIRVFFDGTLYYLADGFHRYYAHIKAGKVSIICEVTNGSLRDAILYSLSANAKHGLQRTPEDKRRGVIIMLEDFEWREWSDREIARRNEVSHTFVSKVREELSEADETDDQPRKYVRDGEVLTRNTRKKTRKVKFEAPEVEDAPDTNQEAIAQLIEENENLTDRLAVVAMDATDEERKQAEELIASLREELKLLKIENKALVKSRDTFQAENVQLKKQVKMLQKKLDEAKA